jgi:hypothetical protein
MIRDRLGQLLPFRGAFQRRRARQEATAFPALGQRLRSFAYR